MKRVIWKRKGAESDVIDAMCECCRDVCKVRRHNIFELGCRVKLEVK